MNRIIIYFRQNEKEPLPGEMEKLAPLEKVLGNLGTTIKIFGHASTEGSDQANMKLSNERARFVEAYFIVMGAGHQQITVTAFGERKPAVAERGRGAELEALRAKNRRVEVEYTEDPYLGYVKKIRVRYGQAVDILRRRLKKLQEMEARTLRHPRRNPYVLRMWQDEVDGTRHELQDYERRLRELDLAEQQTGDYEKIWNTVTRHGSIYDERVRLQRQLVQQTERRLKEVQNEMLRTTDPQQRIFWSEVLTDLQDALKRRQEELGWSIKDQQEHLQTLAKQK